MAGPGADGDLGYPVSGRTSHVIGRRPLARDAANGKLGGVCAGLARHFDLEVFWLRVATVLAALWMPQLMLIGYAIAWLALDARR